MTFFPADLREEDGIYQLGVLPESTYGEELRGSDTSGTTIFGSKDDVSKDDISKRSDQTLTPEPELELENEKSAPKYESHEIGDEDPEVSEENISDDDPVLRDIPWHVRRVVSFQDDPELPTLTFRYFVMTIIFIAPGAFLEQLNVFRTTSAPYSIFFVQIASNYLGEWLAATLPPSNVRIPFTKWSFNLNPGPFSVKEHVLVTIAAASGATYNLAWTPISLGELYFGAKINPAIAIFFMWAVVWTGYSYAAFARQFLIYDPQYPW